MNIFHNFIRNNIINSPPPPQLDQFQEKTNECTALILATQEKYIRYMSNKLNDPLATPKTCWSILNRLLNNRKFAAIPPLLANRDSIIIILKKWIFLTNYIP